MHFIAFHTPCQGVVGVVSGSASPSSPPPIYDAAMDTLDESIDAARSLVDGAQAITVLTGAGISTDSGIPDFRGPNGLWTCLLYTSPSPRDVEESRMPSSA